MKRKQSRYTTADLWAMMKSGAALHKCWIEGAIVWEVYETIDTPIGVQCHRLGPKQAMELLALHASELETVPLDRKSLTIYQYKKPKS